MRKRIFFLTGEWTALKRFARIEVPEPEGMPSVYRPWLHYRSRDYDVHIFMIGSFEEADLIDFRGCKVHIIPRLKLLRRRNKSRRLRCCFPVDSYLLYRAANAVAKSGPPDIIYCQRPWSSYAGWALAKKYRSTFVKRIYGTALYHDWFLDQHLKRKLHSLRELLAWKVPSDMTIITNDGSHGDKIADWLGVDTTKYRMWINGVDKRPSTNNAECDRLREEIGLRKDDFVLLCLSRLATWKRQDRVIKAMPEILESVPNAKLVIVGDGPTRKELESTVRRLHLNSHVHFTGMIVHPKAYELLSMADVFLQTNDISCLGNSLLEALACGKAIVTWDVGGTREVITDGVNGRLLADAEPSTIAKAVIELALNPQIRHSLAQQARRFAQEHLLSWEERLDKEIELVEGLKQMKEKQYSVERTKAAIVPDRAVHTDSPTG